MAELTVELTVEKAVHDARRVISKLYLHKRNLHYTCSIRMSYFLLLGERVFETITIFGLLENAAHPHRHIIYGIVSAGTIGWGCVLRVLMVVSTENKNQCCHMSVTVKAQVDRDQVISFRIRHLLLYNTSYYYRKTLQ